MAFVNLTKENNIATVTLSRGKVNAINEELVDELSLAFKDLAADASTKAVILSGNGKFFSFGFDIPGFLDYTKHDFIPFLRKFNALAHDMFMFTKPVIAAVNGHATAGGCILAITSDYRVMASGKAKIGLNEVNIGAGLFASSIGMAKCCAGHRNAEKIVLSGTLYTAEEAKELGLIDRVASEEALMAEAMTIAREYGAKSSDAFRCLKNLLRKPVADEFLKREEASIHEFVEIWYSEETQRKIKGIEIR